MAGWTIRVVVASLLMASSALAQATNDPFYTPIPAADGVITANVVEFASLPDVDGQPARMMLLVDEPGTGQLFVNDMRGLLYNVSHDGRVVTRYLDLTAPTWGLSIQARGNERGFQSFAFHPQFNQPGTPGFGKLYTYLDTTNTTPTPDFVSGGGSDAHDTILLEWTAENPGAITYDGGPPRELLRFEQPFGNHNGGQVGFDPLLSPGDPDFGLLYIGVADGGSGGDPLDLAQNLGRAFGKILRVDPFGSDSANGKYGLPADNPFANGDASTLPEIYAYGVRNPQRFGWDPTTGNMFLADIGQNIVEEISLVTRGANLGWNDWEGSYRFISRREVSLIDARGEAGLNYPVAEYGQLDPLLQRSSAATGVVVYRDDAIPALTNLLLFGDNPSGEVFAIQADQLPAGGQDAIRRVLFIFQDDEMSKTLLQLIQEKNRGQGRSPATRADLRFGTGPEGQIFLLNKRDGVIRLLVPWQAAEQRQHAGFRLQVLRFLPLLRERSGGGPRALLRCASSREQAEGASMARICNIVVSGVLACVAAAPALAQGHPEERLNTRLVGTHDLQGRSAYHPLPVEQGGRRILYVGHHAGEALNPLTGSVEVNGTSVVDVTDPARPVYLHHIPATGDARGAQMVQVCSGADLPGADPGETYLLRANGNQSHELWDVSDPSNPALVTRVASMGHTPDGEQNTHKNWWECDTGIAYLIGTVDGWRAPRVVQAFDLANPSAPRRIRDFSLDGVQPDATGPVPGGSGVHEVVPLGERLYLSYGTSRNGVLQIVDRERFLRGDPRAAGPLASSPSGLRFPQVGRLDLPFFWGAHTAFPLVAVELADYIPNRDQRTRDFVVLVSESVANECQEARHVVFFVDLGDEAHPMPVSTFQVPEADGGFCARGGRFGPHGTQWSMSAPFYKMLQVFSWFNAGMRVVDVRNPFDPTEVAYYIPATTAKTDVRCVTIDGVERCKTAIQTNNVEVDDRGLIYLVDRANTGLHIVELTGPAAAILDE